MKQQLFTIHHSLLTVIAIICIALNANADPNIANGKKYHIVCMQFTSGCVTDGQSASQPTPLYYLTSATDAEETFWQLNEVYEGEFSIQNAKTRQYITYDGVREDISQNGQLRRYVSMTDQMDGNYSLWTLSYQAEGIYAFRNVGQSDHIWDIRTDSYCVGTYSNSGSANSNQRFALFDEQGKQVVEKQVQPTPTEGYDVSSWLVATTESLEGWEFIGGTWSDPGFGNYRNGVASVVSPFCERWVASAYGPLYECSLQQELANLPQGSYTLAADVIAVRQASNSWWTQPEETGYGVWLFANDARTEAGTRNERPQHYTVDFSVGSNGTVTLGLSVEETNANWVATDNFALYFKGTAEELTEGEKAKVQAELANYFAPAEIEEMIAQCADDFELLEQLRHSVDFMPTIDPLAKGLKNLAINNRAMAWAESIDFYLCSIPESQFGKDYTATITYEQREGWGELKINGTQIPSGSQYTFKNVKAGSSYNASVARTDGKATVSRRVTFTVLPVVRLYGSFNDDYNEGYIQVQEPTMDSIADMLQMKAKWRGGITNGSDKHKRNYHVKLKDADGEKLEKTFFGLRNDNSWILEACQVDMSRVRNRVLTDLWNDYSTPPYYIDKEKKAKTGTNGQFVELILNDEYRGIYCMTENMDRKQMKLKKIDETSNTTHGQLWKSKDWSYAVFMGPNLGHYYPADFLTTPNEYSDMWDKYQVKYPDFEEYGYQTDWTTLYNAVDFVCHSTDDEFISHVAEYFGLPIVIDYYILMETILATDNHGKNMFYAVYDKQKDKKITFGVWDMDASCGQRWSDQYYHWQGMQPEQDYSRYISTQEHGDNNLFKRLRDTDAEGFNEKVRLRYNELRHSHLKTDAILSRFSTYLNRFKLCGAAQREYDRWNGDSDISGHDLDFDNEMDYLTDWFTRRMNYLDTQRFDIVSLPVEGIALATSQQQPVAVYDLNGRRVGTASNLGHLPAGIYVVNGKKVVVK